jgi:hypothetical protein
MQRGYLVIRKMAESFSRHVAHQRELTIAESLAGTQKAFELLERITGCDPEVGTSSWISAKVESVTLGTCGARDVRTLPMLLAGFGVRRRQRIRLTSFECRRFEFAEGKHYPRERSDMPHPPLSVDMRYTAQIR